MANGRRNYPAPRRQIERVYSEVYSQATNSNTAVVLHTVEDSKTLIRLKGHISCMHDDATDETLWMVIHVKPNGVAVVTPATGADLDNDVPEQELVRCTFQSKTDGDRSVWEFDSKGMRKLKAGDQITLTHQAGGVDAWFVAGPVYMWFKE